MLLHIRGVKPQNNELHIRKSLMGPFTERPAETGQKVPVDAACSDVTSCYANQNLPNKMAATM